MKPKQKELMERIFKLMQEREQNIFYQLEDNNEYFVQEIKKLEKNVEKILKAKGALKQEKLEKRALKQLKESAKTIYEKASPSKETFIFHVLLDCLARLSYLLKTESQMIEENEKIYNKEFDIEFTERILKTIKTIDKRCSTFLKKIIKNNDMVINNKLLEKQINDSKEWVVISNKENIKYLIKEYDFLKEIMKTAIIGLTSLEELDFKYEEKEIKEYKYNFSRIKNFVIEVEKELKVFDLLYDCGKYKELVLKSFISSSEKMTHESIDSYLEYLVWLDKKGKLEEEYQLIS